MCPRVGFVTRRECSAYVSLYQSKCVFVQRLNILPQSVNILNLDSK